MTCVPAAQAKDTSTATGHLPKQGFRKVNVDPKNSERCKGMIHTILHNFWITRRKRLNITNYIGELTFVKQVQIIVQVKEVAGFKKGS